MEVVQEQQTQTLHEQLFSCNGSKEKYALLSGLSDNAKLLIELGQTEAVTVNEVLISLYTNEDHQEFNTFFQWKEKGFKVKKGSKAFFIWSKPKPIKGKEEGEKTETKKDEEKEGRKIFRMAYLFSNSQVEPIESK